MKILVKNRKANFEYHILETFVAGIQLKGSEVKSIKNGQVNLTDAYCFIHDGEIYVKNIHVSEHKQGGKANNHQPVRDRKLLLKKKEILSLRDKIKQKGLTIVPISIGLNQYSYIKVEIALVKGKKTYDKKESIKLRDLDREVKKEI